LLVCCQRSFKIPQVNPQANALPFCPKPEQKPRSRVDLR
jgi:hypothetical protein